VLPLARLTIDYAAVLSLVLIVGALFARADDASRQRRAIAGAAACLLILASMATHPLEVATVLFFAAGVVVAALTGMDGLHDARRSVVVTLTMVIAVAAYLQVQRTAVPDVTHYEDQPKRVPRSELVGLMSRRSVLQRDLACFIASIGAREASTFPCCR
jgi:hypothetical protein